MKGYKLFNNDWTCNGYQYKNPNENPNEIYEMDKSPIACACGFHFCEKIEDCFGYYDAVQWNKIAEVEALGGHAKSGD